MPTYAYACTACGHRFEIHQSFTDDALTLCPQCAGHLRKIFFPVGVTFKGSGFYHTDSRSATSGGAGRAAGLHSGPGATKGKDTAGASESSTAKTAETSSSSHKARPVPAAVSATASAA